MATSNEDNYPQKKGESTRRVPAREISRDEIRSATCVALVCADLAILLGGFLLAYWIRVRSGLVPLVTPTPPPPEPYLWLFAGAVPAGMLALAVSRRYAKPRSLWRVALGLALCYGAVLVALFTLKKGHEYSRATLLIAGLLHAVLLSAVGVAASRVQEMLCGLAPTTPVILVGNSETVEWGQRALTRERGYHVVKSVNLDEMSGEDCVRDVVQNTLDGCGTPGSCLVVSHVDIYGTSFEKLLLDCDERLVSLRVIFPAHLFWYSRLEIEPLDGLALLGQTLPLDKFWNRLLKRLVDVVGALVGLVVLGPVALGSAIVVWLESRGPLFYKQKRCGIYGREFTLYKVRTMVPGAEQQTGPVWATEEDPRRTRVGRFLRRFSIDEIPQFWNVLKGEMSLVGPRPERPHFVSKFQTKVRHYMSRHRIKPGMTGLAQVEGWRGNTSVVERLKRDLRYAATWSLILDFKIILRTFASVLRGKGAH